MKFSIIVPTFNSEKWIQQCVNSILSQAFRDFEIIILDSGSTDETLGWLKTIKDERLILYKTDKRLSIEENWGRIINVPKKEYMTILGHDDILQPGFLKEINQLISLNPDASLYQTHFAFINATGKIIRKCKPMKEKYSKYDFLNSVMNNSIDLTATGYVMRSKDYDDIHGIPVNYPNLLFADFELWQRLINKSYMVVSPLNLFSFRVHKSVTSVSQDYRLHAAFEIFIQFLVNLKQQDNQMKTIIEKYGSQFLLFYCKGFSHRLLRTPLENRNGLTIDMFIEKTKELAEELGVEKKYSPEKLFSIQIAKLIDSNPVFRKMFLGFKRIYSQPLYK